MTRERRSRDARALPRLALLSVLVSAAVWPSGLQAQDPAASAGPAPTLDAVSFLTGCWAGVMGNLDMREQWTEAEGGVMLSTTRFFRNGSLADFEFGMIVMENGVPTLWPYPRGTRSEHGFPLVRTEPEFVFENLEHDFPVRIVYARDGEDALDPRIEGHDGQGPGWRLERVACPG